MAESGGRIGRDIKMSLCWPLFAFMAVTPLIEKHGVGG